MSKTPKIGYVLMGMGLLIWALPALYLRYPIPVPFSSPMPLAPGGSLKQTFTIRGSETYFVFLKCREIGEFKELWQNYMNPQKPPTIPCSLHLRILRDGQEIHSEQLDSLKPGIASAGMDYWLLTYLRLASSGHYELQLSNGTDLTYLQPTEPTVQIRLNDAFYENWIINSDIGLLVGGVLFLIGLVASIIGRLSKKEPADKCPKPIAAGAFRSAVRFFTRHELSGLAAELRDVNGDDWRLEFIPNRVPGADPGSVLVRVHMQTGEAEMKMSF